MVVRVDPVPPVLLVSVHTGALLNVERPRHGDAGAAVN